MTQDSRPCKGCGTLIYRTAPVAPIKHYCGPDCRPRCEVEGCGKPRHGLTYCSAHHTRWRRYGDPLAPKVRQPNHGACEVDGCTQPMRKLRLCASHYVMWRRYGKIRDWEYRWGDGGYNPAHRTLQRLRGKADEYTCVDCAGPADEWSYNGGDPDEITDADGRKFTRNVDAYSPRCVRCHRIFDENPIALRSWAI